MLLYTLLSILCLLVGLLLVSKIKFLSKLYIPGSIIGGLIIFFLINLVIFPGSKSIYDDLSNLDDYIMKIFYLFIVILMLRPNSVFSKKSKIAKNSFLMGFCGAISISLSIALGALILYYGFSFFNVTPYICFEQAFGFASGPAPAAVIAKVLGEYAHIEDLTEFAFTFGSIGFIVAFIVGIPAINIFTKNKKINVDYIDNDIVKSTATSSIKKYLKKLFTFLKKLGIKSLFICILTPTVVLMLDTLIVEILTALVPIIKPTLGILEIFICVLFAVLCKKVLKSLNLYNCISFKLYNFIAGLLGDLMIVLAFGAVDLNMLNEYAFSIIVISIIGSIITWCSCYFILIRTGKNNRYQRILASFGTLTGTLNTGVALARIIDPKMKSTVYYELSIISLTMVIPGTIITAPAALLLSSTIDVPVFSLICIAIAFVYIIITLIILRKK